MCQWTFVWMIYHRSTSLQLSVNVCSAESGDVISFADHDGVPVTNPVMKFGRHDVAVLERHGAGNVEATVAVLFAFVSEVQTCDR